MLTPFLRSLIERGLDVSQGVLVKDGLPGPGAPWSNGASGTSAERGELPGQGRADGVAAAPPARLQPTGLRRSGLETLHGELTSGTNRQDSLSEGLDETLTLHRVYGMLGRSLKTTNCLESVNALVEERCAKVDHWQSSSQRHRWLATALLDIEPRGYRHLPSLRAALKRELKIDTTSKKQAA